MSLYVEFIQNIQVLFTHYKQITLFRQHSKSKSAPMDYMHIFSHRYIRPTSEHLSRNTYAYSLSLSGFSEIHSANSAVINLNNYSTSDSYIYVQNLWWTVSFGFMDLKTSNDKYRCVTNGNAYLMDFSKEMKMNVLLYHYCKCFITIWSSALITLILTNILKQNVLGCQKTNLLKPTHSTIRKQQLKVKTETWLQRRQEEWRNCFLSTCWMLLNSVTSI